MTRQESQGHPRSSAGSEVELPLSTDMVLTAAKEVQTHLDTINKPYSAGIVGDCILEIERLRALVPTNAANVEVPTDALIHLVNYQEQCDEDGVMVKVSRQALAEVLVYVQMVRLDLNAHRNKSKVTGGDADVDHR